MAEDHSGTLKVIAGYAQGLRMSKDNRKPTVVASIRMLAKKQSSQPVSTTQKPENVGTCDPTWNETFTLNVADLSNSQLEVTLWDMSEENPKNNSNFLGEVLLNVAKLEPFSGQDVQQLFAVRAGTTIPVDGEVTGKLFLTLKYASAHGGSTANKPVGVTMHMEKPWEEVKPQKYAFEKDLLEDLMKLLNAAEARIEVVGTERGKGERLSHETSTMRPHFLAHVNIHPGKDGADARAPNDVVAELRDILEQKKTLLQPYKAVSLMRDIDVHEPYRKIDPATQATKTPATRAAAPPPAPTPPTEQKPAPPPAQPEPPAPAPPQPQATPAPVPAPVPAATITPVKAATPVASAPTAVARASAPVHAAPVHPAAFKKKDFAASEMVGVGGALEVKVAHLSHLPDAAGPGSKCSPLVELQAGGLTRATAEAPGVYETSWSEAPPLLFKLPPVQRPDQDLLLKVTVYNGAARQQVVGSAEVNMLNHVHPSEVTADRLDQHKLQDAVRQAEVVGHDGQPTIFSLSTNWRPDPKVLPPAPKPAPPPPVVQPPPSPPPVVPPPQAVRPPDPVPPRPEPVPLYTGGNIVLDVKKEIAAVRAKKQSAEMEEKKRSEKEAELAAIRAEEEQKRALAQLENLPQLSPPLETTPAMVDAMQTRASINSVRGLMAPTQRTDTVKVREEADIAIQNSATARSKCDLARNSIAEALQQARARAGASAIPSYQAPAAPAMTDFGLGGGGVGGGGVGPAAFTVKLAIEAHQIMDRNGFLEQLKSDLANAVGVDPQRFTVESCGEIGFLSVNLSLAPAPGSNAAEVVENLRRQHFDPNSPLNLKRGEFTSNILAITVPQKY